MRRTHALAWEASMAMAAGRMHVAVRGSMNPDNHPTTVAYATWQSGVWQTCEVAGAVGSPGVHKGFGSTKDWSVYKTAGAVDSATATFKGKYDASVAGAVFMDKDWWLDMAGFDPHDASHPKALHNLHKDSKGNSSACPNNYTTVLGNIYHIWVTNSNRVLVENHYFRCLVSPTGDGCYNKGMHMAMLNQVIDDNNNFVGVVGIEASSLGGYTYARIDSIEP